MTRAVPTSPTSVARQNTQASTIKADVTKPTYRRGDIWFVTRDTQNPPIGTELWADRPAVIISNNVSSNRSGFVEVIYLTTSTNKRTGPTHVDLGELLGDGRQTMALCEQIHTVDVSRLRRKQGFVDRHAMRGIDAAIKFALSINHDPDDFALYRKWEAHLKTFGVDMAAEIEALSSRTTDERVEALQRALTVVTQQRDAYRALYESATQVTSLAEDLQTVLLTAPTSPAQIQEINHD